MSITPSSISKLGSPKNMVKTQELKSQQSYEDDKLLEDFEKYYKAQKEKNLTNLQSNIFLDRVVQQRMKLKLDGVTKEQKFNEIIGAHKQQRTFVDITKFLYDMNSLNSKILLSQTKNIKEKFEQHQKLKMLEDFVNENIEVKHAGAYGYFKYLENIREKIHLQEKKKNIHVHNFQTQQKLTDLRNLNDQIHNCLEEKTKLIPVELNYQQADLNNDFFEEQLEHIQIPKKNEDDFFFQPPKKENKKSVQNIEQIKLEEQNQQLQYKFQKLETLKNKLLTQIDENVDLNDPNLANIFKRKADKVINHLEKLQMTEKQQHLVIRENMQQYTRKVAKPKKLLEVLKLINVKRQLKQSTVGQSIESVSSLQDITQGKRTKTLSTIKNYLKDQSSLSTSLNRQKYDSLELNYCKSKFKRKGKDKFYKNDFTDKVDSLITEIDSQTQKNLVDKKQYYTQLSTIQTLNNYQLSQHQLKKIDTIKNIDTSDAFSFKYKKQKFLLAK